MQAQSTFKELIMLVGASLKNYGYTRSSNAFYGQQHGNWSVIAFQKSLSSTQSELLFTINIGICSATIREFLDPDNIHKKPIIDECQWKLRMGDLTANGDDKWWSINEQTNKQQLLQEILHDIIHAALPEIEKYISDETLQKLWLSGASTGITKVQSLVNLCILLKKFNMQDQLNSTLEQLEKDTEGKPAASMVKVVKRYLLKLE